MAQKARECPCLSGMRSLGAERDRKQVIAQVMGNHSGRGCCEEGAGQAGRREGSSEVASGLMLD